MGRAKNLPVGGKDAGVRRQCRRPLPPARGRSSLPLAGASERRAQDDSVRECYMCLLACPPAGEILPAVGGRKRTACGRQDDARRAGRDNTRGVGRMVLKDLNRPPAVCYSSRYPTTNKDHPAKRCHSEPAPYGWAVRRISLLAEMLQGKEALSFGSQAARLRCQFAS